MLTKICVFDAYGTLFDVNSAARKCSDELGNVEFTNKWPVVSTQWREKQLSYSWLMSMMKSYHSFWDITKDALDYALEFANIDSNEKLKSRLLKLYLEIDAYPEVSETLKHLKKEKIMTAILSNGSPDMLNSAVRSAKIDSCLDAVLSVEKVKVFKPDRRVYKMVMDNFDFSKSEVLFISSNGWDIAGAARYGYRTVWINRTNLPQDRLMFRPDFVCRDLNSVMSIAKKKL